MGPLKKVPGGYTHMVVTVNKFKNGLRIAMVKSDQALEFFLDIIHRFGVPNSIITDNSTQFTARKFHKFRNDYNIKVDWAVVAHPRTNGQVERANDMIL